MVDVNNALGESNFDKRDWHALGLQLKIKISDLDAIKSNHYNMYDYYLVECLIKWLVTGTATYTGLAEALRKMGEHEAAGRLIGECVCIFILSFILEFHFKIARL